MISASDTKTGLYLHIPFCSQKCFFCSFVICVARMHRAQAYLEALEREAKQYQGTPIDTIYVGGGTPTLLQEAHLAQLDDLVRKYFRFSNKAEYTFETNPDTLTQAKARLLRSRGVNRLSIGAQTFDRHVLRFLGRTHLPEDIRRCYDLARQAGFHNINVDLMFGFPDQTWRHFRKDLSRAMALGSEHLCVYSLTVDPRSRFHRQALALPSCEHVACLYDRACHTLESNAWHQYEISNFAKTGYASRHNIAYWECQDYIGLGIGAHSHLGRRRFWNIDKLFPYVTRIAQGRSVIEGREVLGRHRRLTEALLIGLRMNQGVDIRMLQKRFAARLTAGQKAQIAKFAEQGFFLCEQEILKTTAQGRLLLDELCGYLI